MLFTLLITMILALFRACEGSPTYQEEYRGTYTPDFITTKSGYQVVAPDTPYVAAAGPNQLYFIDTRFDTETARHIKLQIERATIQNSDEYIAIDELSATAEIKNSITGETVFTFDPPYARVLFAKGINRHNPDIKLPEHEPAGDWLVTYDMNTALNATLDRRALYCYDYGCNNRQDCISQSNGNCNLCHQYRIDNECDVVNANAIGACRLICDKAVDEPRQEGETDASYYQRMDALHWG